MGDPNPYTPPRADEPLPSPAKPTKPEPSLEALTKSRRLFGLIACMIAFSAGMKLAGVFAVGFFPVWAEWMFVAYCAGMIVHTSWKIRRIEQRQFRRD